MAAWEKYRPGWQPILQMAISQNEKTSFQKDQCWANHWRDIDSEPSAGARFSRHGMQQLHPDRRLPSFTPQIRIKSNPYQRAHLPLILMTAGENKKSSTGPAPSSPCISALDDVIPLFPGCCGDGNANWVSPRAATRPASPNLGLGRPSRRER